MWGRDLRGDRVTCSALAPLSVTTATTHKQIGPVWCWFPGGGGFVNILGPCWSLQQILLWGWELLPLLYPSQVFSIRGLEALFPCNGTLDFLVCLAPQLFLLVYLHTNVGPPSPLATTLPWVLSSLAAHLWSYYQSGWMFLLYLLGCWTSIWFDFLAVLVVVCS